MFVLISCRFEILGERDPHNAKRVIKHYGGTKLRPDQLGLLICSLLDKNSKYYRTRYKQ